MSRKVIYTMVFFLAALLATAPAWSALPDSINPVDAGKRLTADPASAADGPFAARIILARGGNPDAGDCEPDPNPDGDNGNPVGGGFQGPHGPNGPGDGDPIGTGPHGAENGSFGPNRGGNTNGSNGPNGPNGDCDGGYQ